LFWKIIEYTKLNEYVAYQAHNQRGNRTIARPRNFQKYAKLLGTLTYNHFAPQYQLVAAYLLFGVPQIY